VFQNYLRFCGKSGSQKGINLLQWITTDPGFNLVVMWGTSGDGLASSSFLLFSPEPGGLEIIAKISQSQDIILRHKNMTFVQNLSPC